MKVESIRVKNYKALQDVTVKNLPSLCVFLGANGAGKTTLFDVFSFLRDSLMHNVRQAVARRGGFKELVSRGQSGPIEIEIKFRDDGPLITYILAIGERNGFSVVERELLKYRRGSRGLPWHFLDFRMGEGEAITNEQDYDRPDAEQQREHQRLESPDILAIKGLGQFQKFEVVAKFRKLIESWHISDFQIGEARNIPEAGYAEHLSARGENLPLVAQYLYENHREVFNLILEKMSERVPGVEKVEAEQTVDGRVVLRFKDGSFKDPFISRHVSDGTIKMFAYLLLLNDPNPHPLLAVEEPENQLHPLLMTILAEEFRGYSLKGGQVFISTHSPDFVNGIKLEELFWLKKQNGYSEIIRASEDENLVSLVKNGDLPGSLWKQKLFLGAGPK